MESKRIMKHRQRQGVKVTYIPVSMDASLTVRFGLVALRKEEKCHRHGEPGSGNALRVQRYLLTLIFFCLQVRHPVLLRVYWGRFLSGLVGWFR